MSKVLEAYTGRRRFQPTLPAAKRRGLYMHWPNVGANLPSMIRVVIVLLRQCDDQLKIRLT